MKSKTVAAITLTLFMISTFTLALSTKMVSADAKNVGACLDRLFYHDASVFDDSVSHSDWLDGQRMRSFYIRPQDTFDVDDARIEMFTTFANTPDNFHGINWNPHSEDPDIFTVTDPSYTYVWDWSSYSIPQAGVGIHTNFPVTFQPGFDLARAWDPYIAKSDVTQTLMIEFTSSTEYAYDFFNAHISVQIPNTPEASPSIDPDSISVDPPEDQRESLWNMEWWVNEEGYTVNWNGDPEAGVTYTFSVDVTVVNELYPTPILYKPSAGVGANYDMPYPGGYEIGLADSLTIVDDMDGVGGIETSVTYSGRYSGEQLYWWIFTQKENSVSLPSYNVAVSEKGHFWSDAHDITYIEDKDDWRGTTFSNLFSFGHMLTPWNGEVRDWEVSSVSYGGSEGAFTGTFTIRVEPPEPWMGGYIYGGEMYVSFEAKLERIPLYEGEPNAHIHFWGKFEITDGTGQYAGLTGEGEISGTIHLHHEIDVEPPYYDLVMIGEYKTKQVK